MHSFGQPRLQSLFVGLEIHDGDFVGRNLEMFYKNGQCAAGHRTKANEKYALVELEHPPVPPVALDMDLVEHQREDTKEREIVEKFVPARVLEEMKLTKTS